MNVNDVNEDMLWHPPKGLFDAYRQWAHDARTALLEKHPGDEEKEFRAIIETLHRESEEELLQRLRGLPKEKRSSTVRMYMSGYEMSKLLVSDRTDQFIAILRKNCRKHGIDLDEE